MAESVSQAPSRFRGRVPAAAGSSRSSFFYYTTGFLILPAMIALRIIFFPPFCRRCARRRILRAVSQGVPVPDEDGQEQLLLLRKMRQGPQNGRRRGKNAKFGTPIAGIA